MGKAQSTEVSGKGGNVSYSPSGRAEASGVQMRKQKGSKKTKEDRPMSYPGPVGASGAATNDMPVFNFKSTTSELSGRPNQRSSEIFNPVMESPDESSATYSVPTKPTSTSNEARNSVAVQPTASSKPHGNGSITPSRTQTPTVIVRPVQHSTTQTDIIELSASERNSFERVLDQVILIWPRFKELRSIDLRMFNTQTVRLLREVCSELLDEYKAITEFRSMHQKHQAQLETMGELEEQCRAHEQKLKRKEVEIARLQETIAMLRPAHQDPGYTSGSDDLEDRRSTDLGLQQKSPTRFSDDSADPEDSGRFKKSRIKDKIYQPTPLIIAEGEERSKMIVKRTHSLKPVSTDARPAGYEKPTTSEEVGILPPGAGVEEKLRWLERSLDREKHENASLRERLKSSQEGDSGRFPISELMSTRIASNVEDLVDRYRRLEEHAVGRLYASLKQYKVADKRLSQFICSVMETSYTMSLSSVLHYSDAVQNLLQNPLKWVESRSNAGPRTSVSGPRAVKGHVKMFEESPYRLGHRSVEFGDVGEMLLKQMTAYLQKTSEAVELSTLAENVLEGLRHSFSDCTSPAILHEPLFSQFLNDCCRLAWQMAVASPPLYVSTESLRLDDREHETLMQEEVTNARIDFYLWPILYDRRHGSVLYKGRVVIRSYM